jgi:dUTPase
VCTKPSNPVYSTSTCTGEKLYDCEPMSKMKTKCALHLHSKTETKTLSRVPEVLFDIHPTANFLPKICENSNGLDIPLQEKLFLHPAELSKVNLKIRFQLPKHYCGLLMNKSSARVKYNVQVQLGLIDVGFTDYLQIVVQNMSSEIIQINAGIAIAQLLLIKNKIPVFKNLWPHVENVRGSFGSTGQSFQIIQKNHNNNSNKTTHSQFTEVESQSTLNIK